MGWIKTWDGDWVNMDLLANICTRCDGTNYFVYGFWPHQPDIPINLYGPFNSRPEAQNRLDRLFAAK